MRRLPTSADANGRSFTVADFIEAGRVELLLELLAGGGHLDRRVVDPSTNRPGLALTGFLECFASWRLQVFGCPEMAYLRTLGQETRDLRVRTLLEHGAHCFVFTNGERPDPDVIATIERHGGVVLATPLRTRLFTHLATVILERLSAPCVALYGTMVETCGMGVLIEGSPGLGKSETALGLIKRGSALVADDLTCVRREFGHDLLYGSASDLTAGYMEIRGIGILHIPSIFGVDAVRGEKRLQLVISFRRLSEVEGELDRVGQTLLPREILGVKVPNIIIPVSAGRDLVNLVESAAQQQKLILSGYDPVRELSKRFHRRSDDTDFIDSVHQTSHPFSSGEGNNQTEGANHGP